MPKEGVTYRQVEEVCDLLAAENRRITVRAILAETGGSSSTVLKHFQHWQQRQAAKGKDLEGYSDPFRKALATEIARHVAAARHQDKDLIADLRRQVDEAAGLLAEAEGRAEEAEMESDKKAGRIADLEKELAVTRERERAGHETGMELSGRLERMARENGEIEKELAVLKARLSERSSD